MSTILLIAVIVGAALGALVGTLRKFTKTSLFGVTVILSVLLSRAVGAIAGKDSDSFGWLSVIGTVAVLAAFTVLLMAFRRFFKGKVKARMDYSHYKNTDEREENEELILSAIDSGDKRQYKKLRKKGRKIKDSAGGWGVIDRVLGGVFGAANLLIVIGLIVVCLVTFADLSGIGGLYDAFEGVITSGSWENIGKAYGLDLLIISILSLAIGLGYRNGICSLLNLVVILGLVAGFAAAAWSIASSSACEGAVEGLKNGFIADMSFIPEDLAVTVAEAVLAAIIFLLSLVLIVVVGIFFPKLTDKLRDNAAFSFADGIIGAVVLTAIILVLFVAAGGIAGTLSDLQFMAKFGSYTENACIADGLYSLNPLASVFEGLPVRGWFGD